MTYLLTLTIAGILSTHQVSQVDYRWQQTTFTETGKLYVCTGSLTYYYDGVSYRVGADACVAAVFTNGFEVK